MSLLAHRIATPRRFFSTVRRSVFISQSNDVYANLALEHWLGENFDFKEHQVLLLTKNEPCVVLGKQQNPWIEIDADAKVARRPGDGEAVYQDTGRLNMTFFTEKDSQDKGYNLAVIARAAFRKFGVKLLQDGEELNIRHKRISQSCSEIGDRNALHYCSLLVNTSRPDLEKTLRRQKNLPTSTKFLNLIEENPKATLNDFLKAVGFEYLRTKASYLQDGGMALVAKQRGFHLVNPTDEWFPGLRVIKERLQSWDWCYGATPKFTMSKSFHNGDVNISVMVEDGRIGDVNLYLSSSFPTSAFVGWKDWRCEFVFVE